MNKGFSQKHCTIAWRKLIMDNLNYFIETVRLVTAYTDPKLIIKWLGLRELTMKIETFEPRSGGSYRYIHSDNNGNQYGIHGVIHVVSPERIIQTFEFEGLPEKRHVLLGTTKFESLPGNRTRLTNQSLFQSVPDRDGMLKSGMERGVNDSHERLDELFAKGLPK